MSDALMCNDKVDPVLNAFYVSDVEEDTDISGNNDQKYSIDITCDYTLSILTPSFLTAKDAKQFRKDLLILMRKYGWTRKYKKVV